MSKIPKNKFKHTVHYILWFYKKDKLYISAVKLNKIIWLLDVWYFCKKKQSLTGEQSYIKRRYGPVPRKILATLEALNKEGKLQIKGYTKKGRPDVVSAQVTEPSAKDINTLSQDEREQIDSFCRRLQDRSGKELSNFSHNNVYNAYKEGEEIPLAAYLLSESRVPGRKDIQRAKEIFKL